MCYGPEFVARAVRDWIGAAGAKTTYIAPGRPWKNGSIESFNARLRDELFDGEIFYTLAEAKIVIESWPPALQHEAPALLARLQVPGTGGYRAAVKHGRKADHALD